MDRLKNLLSRGIAIFQKNRMTVYSGYATLFIVTAVFPCIILIISIVNMIPGYSAKDVAAIIFQILPNLGPIKELVVSMMEDLKTQSGGLLASIAAVTTLWSASKGVLAIQQGLDQLDSKYWEKAKEESNGIKDKGKSELMRILKRLVFTFELVILIPALLVFDMLGGSLAGAIRSAVEKLNPDVLDSTLKYIDSFFSISSAVVIVLALLVIMQIYATLPGKRRTLKSQLPGTILTAICWFAFTELFAFFIPRFYHASNIYGSLASLFLVLLWLRFIVMILFAGGVLNRAIEEERQDN